MFIAWGVFCYCRNAAIIDVFWGMNITSIGLLYLSFGTMTAIKIISAILLLIWGCRLSLYLFWTRIKKGENDRRYEMLSAGWRNKIVGFLWQYLFQGLLAWLLAIPFFFLSAKQDFSLIDIGCIALIIIGLIGETIADLQLFQHKKVRSNHVCQFGLWQYSRHPNYFFECLIWLGFSFMAADLSLGLFSMLSILTLFSVMWFFTIPMTESVAIEKRGQAYVNYQQTTSKFLPWF